MAIRTFTVYPQTGAADACPQDTTYAIRATYPEARLERRYGALEVCRGWTRDQVLAQFRKVEREDAVVLLGRDLTSYRSVQIQMNSNDLRLWNH